MEVTVMLALVGGGLLPATGEVMSPVQLHAAACTSK